MHTWCRYIVIWHSLTFSEHSHWVHTGCTGCTLDTLWVHFGCTLGTPWVHFGCTLGALWMHFGRTLDTLWAHFGRTLHALWAHSDILCRKITGTDAYLVQVFSDLALTHIWCTFTLGALWTHSGHTLTFHAEK
jgi:hypothetical protein